MRRLCLLLGLLVFGCTGNDPTSPGVSDPKAGRYSFTLTDSSTGQVSTGTLTITGAPSDTVFAVAITSSNITVQPSMARAAGSPWFVFATVASAFIPIGSAQVPVRLALTWFGTNVTCNARNGETLLEFGPCGLAFQGP
jgi:hypothetical protein